ncbi:EAL domain-containing protein [Henriciella sp. AS95]|uniref:EAL domain-containing protein n=1 Tax=Henriciella sp. AS95 TaxID=3135782 RepID=UPI00316EB4B4
MGNYSDTNVGHWKWDAGDRRLEIQPLPQSPLDDLGGIWSLDAIGVLLDGLSRSRLERALDPSRKQEPRFACVLGLSNGGAIRLTGEFGKDGSVVGDLIQEIEPGVSVAGTPGPGLKAVFQPIISLSTGNIAGFEALARWDGEAPQLHTGHTGIGDAALAPNMLIRASEALSMWRKDGFGDDLFVNVNLTGRDLARDDLAGLVDALVTGHGFSAGQLRIEITEQAALRDAAEAVRVADALKKAGAGVILDDFGSGHSSFSWLAALPADGLKIDPELTRQIGNPKVDTILETVTLLASKLGMSATAEGIEDLGQISVLKHLGFDFAQGFAFSKPLSSDDALSLLAS